MTVHVSGVVVDCETPPNPRALPVVVPADPEGNEFRVVRTPS